MRESRFKTDMSRPQLDWRRTRKLYEPDAMRVQGISAGLHHTVERCVVIAYKGVSSVFDGRRKIVLDAEKSLGKFGNVGRAIHLLILLKK
jgi:hypothetical protein